MNASPRRTVVTVAAIIAGLFVLLWLYGPDEQSYIDTRDAVAHAAPAVTVGATVTVPPTTSTAASAPVAPTEYAEAADPHIYRNAPIPGDTLPVQPPPAGDCDAWGDVFRSLGATADEIAFFVPHIINRESGCGRDTHNESSGDTGICQVNPIHNRAGYFGGRYFGDGGWLLELHGLTTRVDTGNPSWASACLTLFRVCGTGPWRPPYSCANNQL